MERTGRSIEKNKIGIMLFVICVHICMCRYVRMYKHTQIFNAFLCKVIHACEKNSINTEEIRQEPQTGSSWKNPTSQRALFDSYSILFLNLNLNHVGWVMHFPICQFHLLPHLFLVLHLTSFVHLWFLLCFSSYEYIILA